MRPRKPRHPRVFPDFYRGIVRSAELTGELDTVLSRLAIYIERDLEARRKIQSASIYPAVILGMSLVTVTVLSVFVLPKFKDSTEFVKWLPKAKGKIVLLSPAWPTCRPSEDWMRWSTPESMARMDTLIAQMQSDWSVMTDATPDASMKAFVAGAGPNIAGTVPCSEANSSHTSEVVGSSAALAPNSIARSRRTPLGSTATRGSTHGWPEGEIPWAAPQAPPAVRYRRYPRSA